MSARAAAGRILAMIASGASGPRFLGTRPRLTLAATGARRLGSAGAAKQGVLELLLFPSGRGVHVEAGGEQRELRTE